MPLTGLMCCRKGTGMVERIDSKTPEQIRQALEYLAVDCPDSAKCKDCAYGYDCVNEQLITAPKAAIDDALAMIQRLEAERNAALAKAPRWISVKDELPPKHLRVLLMNGHRMVASGHLTYVKAKCGTSLWCMDGVNRNDVTHWAKLPEPPEEK